MGKFRRSRGRQILTAIVVLLIVALRWWSDASDTQSPGSGSSQRRPGTLIDGEYRVERVVDGDTLLLAETRYRVRLQGIDTPETVKDDTPVAAWGPEATAFTKRFLSDAGGRIRVEVDGETTDQSGRYLAFVWDGDRMLNEELVRAGLAKAKLHYDYGQAKKDRLRRAQQEAQRAGRGIWSGDSAPPARRSSGATTGRRPAA